MTEYFDYSMIGFDTSILATRRPINPTDLLKIIQADFSPSQSLQLQKSFNMKPQGFLIRRNNGDEKWQNNNLFSSLMSVRMDRICRLLSIVDIQREPLTQNDLYEIFSVIACNWFSIHGCIEDGHKRALFPIFKSIFQLAKHCLPFGIPDVKDESYNRPGYDLEASLYLFSLNLHLTAGTRILAAGIEFTETGLIDEVLLDQEIVWNSKARSKANKYARACLLKKGIHIFHK